MHVTQSIRCHQQGMSILTRPLCILQWLITTVWWQPQRRFLYYNSWSTPSSWCFYFCLCISECLIESLKQKFKCVISETSVRDGTQPGLSPTVSCLWTLYSCCCVHVDVGSWSRCLETAIWVKLQAISLGDESFTWGLSLSQGSVMIVLSSGWWWFQTFVSFIIYNK